MGRSPEKAGFERCFSWAASRHPAGSGRATSTHETIARFSRRCVHFRPISVFHRRSMPLFASTILLSAFLLFLVQPIIAKQILPWFGGTSAVWTTCLVFFQVVLLAGYTYSHLTTRYLSPKQQARLHIALLAVSLLFLPIIPSEALKPAAGADAALRIVVLLVATIGLPYFLLSSTGPLLQKWVAPRFPEKSVYRLFALSNFGSLIGLLAFPFAIEPFSTSHAQSIVWSIAYGVFAVACAVSAWKASHSVVADSAALNPIATDPEGPAPRLGDYALWLAFAALGSVLLLATTSHITQNIASVPFLWVLPLSLYLLSFVIAFEGREGRGWYQRSWFLFPTLLLLVAMAAGLEANRGVLDVSLAVPLYTVGMMMAAFFCNGELALSKPVPRYLTQFYLTISLGGALGGMLVGLVAPRVFPTYFELPVALVLLVVARRVRCAQDALADRTGGRRHAGDRVVRKSVHRISSRRRRVHAPKLLRHAAGQGAGSGRSPGAPLTARRDPARRTTDHQCQPARARHVLRAYVRAWAARLKPSKATGRSDWASSGLGWARCRPTAAPVTSFVFTSSIPTCSHWRKLSSRI